MPHRILFLIALLVSLHGCQLWGEPVRGARPPAATFGEYREIGRGLEIRVGERIHYAYARLSLTPESTLITVTDEEGRLMVEMHYGQGRLNVKRTPYLPPEVSADDLIADLQLALWPLERLRAGLIKSIRNSSDGTGPSYIGETLAELGAALRDDQRLQRQVNRFTRRTAVGVATRYGDQIVQLVSETVRRWDAVTITDRVESAVGRDLQFIRINGTLVGGLVGLTIHALNVYVI